MGILPAYVCVHYMCGGRSHLIKGLGNCPGVLVVFRAGNSECVTFSHTNSAACVCGSTQMGSSFDRPTRWSCTHSFLRTLGSVLKIVGTNPSIGLSF